MESRVIGGVAGMKKAILTVGLIVGALLLILLAWQVFFGDGGALETAWNAVADTINEIWQNITGGSSELLPQWGASGNTLADAWT